MRRSLGFLVPILAAVVLGSILPMPAAAQDGGKAAGQGSAQEKKVDPNDLPLPPGGPAPRLGDGHPDLSGVWFPGTTGHFDFINSVPTQRQFDPKVTPEERPSFQPWAAAKIKAMTPTELELGKASVNCIPRGVPGIFINNPYPIQLVETPGQLVQLVELLNNFRVVPTNGRAHEKDPDPTFNGDAVGHWEGDTLVIDIIALDERTWNNMGGWFHSDQEHVIEHWSRKGDVISWNATVEDPVMFTKPWQVGPRRAAIASDDDYIQPQMCVGYTKGHFIEPSAKDPGLRCGWCNPESLYGGTSNEITSPVLAEQEKARKEGKPEPKGGGGGGE